MRIRFLLLYSLCESKNSINYLFAFYKLSFELVKLNNISKIFHNNSLMTRKKCLRTSRNLHKVHLIVNAVKNDQYNIYDILNKDT